MKLLKPRSASDTRLTMHGLPEERRLARIDEEIMRAEEDRRRTAMTRGHYGDTRRPRGDRP